jgi:Holliday junction DNA helicase RuvA
MIAFVHGMAVDMTESSVVVEAGGIGYEIYMTGADLSEIRMGEDVKVHTYFSVREDAMKLYGFRAKDDLQMFKLLLGVNGVGPKAALGVLAGITADELRFAILSDDVKTLSKAPGIGKKTAQKLILELKDKINKGVSEISIPTAQVQTGGAMNDVVAALTVLGYSSSEIAPVLNKLDISGMTTEEAIKAILRKMTN